MDDDVDWPSAQPHDAVLFPGSELTTAGMRRSAARRTQQEATSATASQQLSSQSASPQAAFQQPAASSSSNRGRQPGSPTYTQGDVKVLLMYVRWVLPRSTAGWGRVKTLYNVSYADLQGRPTREAASLQRKFEKLVNAYKPTGTGTCPPEVRDAKALDQEIKAAMSAVVLSDGTTRTPTDEDQLRAAREGRLLEEGEPEAAAAAGNPHKRRRQMIALESIVDDLDARASDREAAPLVQTLSLLLQEVKVGRDRYRSKANDLEKELKELEKHRSDHEAWQQERTQLQMRLLETKLSKQSAD